MAVWSAMTHVSTFQALDARDPGGWALVQNARTFQWSSDAAVEGRGLQVTLFRAVPVPDREMPFQDILQFKEKRRDELLAFRAHIDSLQDAIVKSADPAAALRQTEGKILTYV